jgi:hypothetical protein
MKKEYAKFVTQNMLEWILVSYQTYYISWVLVDEGLQKNIGIKKNY